MNLFFLFFFFFFFSSYYVPYPPSPPPYTSSTTSIASSAPPAADHHACVYGILRRSSSTPSRFRSRCTSFNHPPTWCSRWWAEMLASSPSPSAALRPASASSPSSGRPHSSFPQTTTTTVASSSPSSPPHPYPPPQSAAHQCNYEPVRTSVVPPTQSQFSPRSSRVAVEELRSALTRHTVESSPNGPSGDLPRGRMSAGLTSLGGSSHPTGGSHPGASNSANSDSSHDTHSYSRGSSSSTNQPLLRSSGGPSINPTSAAAAAAATAPSTIPGVSPTTSAPPASVPAPAPVPAPPAPTSSVPPAMPSFTTNPGSNKRNSRDEPMPDAALSGQSGRADREGSQSKRYRPSKPTVKVLPRDYDQADPRDIVALISSMLLELIHFNDKIPLHQGRLTRFHSRSPPRISVHDYLQRLTTHATLSPPILLSMVYYIDRLCALYPAFNVSSLTIHRFLIASATVASKGLSDSFWTNKTYARVGGISMTELALLELEFLFRVEWRIVPQPEVLVDYYQSLVERCEGYEIQRG